jgi:hypothetical protein
VIYLYVHMRIMVMLIYDYMVVEKIDDTKKWLIELPCMFRVGC